MSLKCNVFISTFFSFFNRHTMFVRFVDTFSLFFYTLTLRAGHRVFDPPSSYVHPLRCQQTQRKTPVRSPSPQIPSVSLKLISLEKGNEVILSSAEFQKFLTLVDLQRLVLLMLLGGQSSADLCHAAFKCWVTLLHRWQELQHAERVHFYISLYSIRVAKRHFLVSLNVWIEAQLIVYQSRLNDVSHFHWFYFTCPPGAEPGECVDTPADEHPPIFFFFLTTS